MIEQISTINKLGAESEAMFGRGAAGKIPLFGLIKRGGTVMVYAWVIADAKGATLVPIIERKGVPVAVQHT